MHRFIKAVGSGAKRARDLTREEARVALGLDVTAPLDGPRAAAGLRAAGVAALDLPRYCPPLARLVELRPLFGVRTVAQTLMKLLDPLAADARIVGVFHAPYLPSTAAALADRHGASLCVQALGGLPEASPGKLVRVCRPGSEPETIDLRALAAEVADASGAPASERAARPAAASLVDEVDDDAVAASAAAAAAARAVADARAVTENRAALEGVAGPSLRAAAAAALLLHVARGLPPLVAAEAALAALRDGRARAVAERLRQV